jgi:hypothetical protein
MGDACTTSVAGKGKILLKSTFGKSLALHAILHIPDIRRNLLSGSLLNKARIKMVFDTDKVVLTRNGDFIGKGYYCHGGFCT